MRLAGVVLAAGLGTRLAPLTTLRPKALCPVNGVALLDLALARIAAAVDSIAVNAHHRAEMIVAHVGDRAHISVETGTPLGTAGALGALRPWLDGRAALVANADAWLDGDPATALTQGWTGDTVRVLVTEDPKRADFGGRWRMAGLSLLPAPVVAGLSAEYSSLFNLAWVPALEAGTLELVEHDGEFVDCGTPADYLAANLLASGGVSVIGEGAAVEGELTESVVWPGARVERGEHLVRAIRATDGLTVQT